MDNRKPEWCYNTVQGKIIHTGSRQSLCLNFLLFTDIFFNYILHNPSITNSHGSIKKSTHEIQDKNKCIKQEDVNDAYLLSRSFWIYLYLLDNVPLDVITAWIYTIQDISLVTTFSPTNMGSWLIEKRESNRERQEEKKERGKEQGQWWKKTFMKRNSFHNLHLAPQEKNSDFQEAVSRLIISEKEMRLEKEKWYCKEGFLLFYPY